MSQSNEACINPVKLEPYSKWNFSCHKDVKCFTSCCRDINIILTPYDIFRLKKRLQLSSEEFLAIYTEPQLLEKTDMPVVTLKLLEEEGSDEKKCPFVREDGCIVYEDRPTACRYYPLGSGTLNHKDDEADDKEGFYFFINEPHCKGFDEEDLWNVQTWREDQGLDIYDEINKGWTELMVKKRSFPANIKLTPKAKELFFMVSYNFDKFKRFVFESQFLERNNIDAETAKKIKNDDVELIKFGFKWLDSLIFKNNVEESQPQKS